VGKAFLLRIACCALNLVVVVVQSNDVGARELDDLSCWSSHTTADIQHSHTVPETHDMCKVVLVASNGLSEGLAIGKATEMKALSPTILV
jgi:hypothetical protein